MFQKPLDLKSTLGGIFLDRRNEQRWLELRKITISFRITCYFLVLQEFKKERPSPIAAFFIPENDLLISTSCLFPCE